VNFTVGWDPDALSDFHQLWAASPDPAAARTARETVERRLAADPSGAGRHLSEGLWQIRVPPFAIYYRIDPDLHLVETTNVFLTG